MVVWGGLTNSCERKREVKSKGEKERHKHLNAEFQRIARRDKKAFLRDQCKQIEENNRMGKTRDLFKKIRDTKGNFHALEKEMATHSSVLAWRIPGPGDPGGLPSMGSHRVGHDCSNLAAVAESRGGQRRPPNKNVLELGPEKWIASQEGDDRG